MTNSIFNKKWYSSGLKFTCTECGRCCLTPQGQESYVHLLQSDIEQISQLLDIDLDTFLAKYTKKVHGHYVLINQAPNEAGEHPCIFLENKKCKVWTKRPRQCQTFPWWPSALKSPEAWEETAQNCEGICDEAPLHSFEEIELQRVASRKVFDMWS